MPDTHRSDKELLDAITRSDPKAWEQLVSQFQGRLLNFARSRVSSHAESEDLVQETFVSFLTIFQKQAFTIDNLNAYLYQILRNLIHGHYRSRWSRSICLIQDAYYQQNGDIACDAASDIPDPASNHGHQEEADLQRNALVQALTNIINAFLKGRKFQNIKLCDLIFYSRLESAQVSQFLKINDNTVRVFKHRICKQFQEQVATYYTVTQSSIIDPVNTLPAIWEACRPTCPKDSTLGKFINEDLDSDWFDCIDFHLTTFGCHFCRASYKDLLTTLQSDAEEKLQERILHSTIGFFQQP